MPPLVREVIGEVLRVARISQGRTLREVSDTARVSLGYSEVERGQRSLQRAVARHLRRPGHPPMSTVLTDAGERMAAEERAAFGATSIDASTKVVIPPVA